MGMKASLLGSLSQLGACSFLCSAWRNSPPAVSRHYSSQSWNVCRLSCATTQFCMAQSCFMSAHGMRGAAVLGLWKAFVLQQLAPEIPHCSSSCQCQLRVSEYTDLSCTTVQNVVAQHNCACASFDKDTMLVTEAKTPHHAHRGTFLLPYTKWFTQWFPPFLLS